MKIIHSADLHLGSEFRGKLPPEKSKMRRDELRKSFVRLVEYAGENRIGAVILAGDVFDSDKPYKRDKDWFYEVVSGHKEITFYYLRGNHDGAESYCDENFENLKTFGSEWRYYNVGDVVIAGIESNSENTSSRYATLKLEKDKKNIVVMHGQLLDSVKKDSVVSGKLRDKNIDYLALGHIHKYCKYSLDERGSAVYSGCLEGRGFDECGPKGFVVIDTDTMAHEFIPFSIRTIHDISVDISESRNTYEAYEKVKDDLGRNKCKADDLALVTLKGEVSFDSDDIIKDMKNYLSDVCFFIDIKDKTKRKYTFEPYSKDISLVGEFFRTVDELDGVDDSEKEKIKSIGYKALKGEKELI